MKKFIPILNIAIVSVCLQNCSHREEDIISSNNVENHVEKSMLVRKDSVASINQTIYPKPPDPPVRDGDNWRISKDK